MSVQDKAWREMLATHATGWLLALVGGLFSLLIGVIVYSYKQGASNFEQSIGRVAVVVQDHEQQIRLYQARVADLEKTVATLDSYIKGRKDVNAEKFERTDERLKRLERR